MSVTQEQLITAKMLRASSLDTLSWSDLRRYGKIFGGGRDAALLRQGADRERIGLTRTTRNCLIAWLDREIVKKKYFTAERGPVRLKLPRAE
jgi:hypothetical protein